YDLSKEDSEKVFSDFKRIADKKSVSQKEFEAIIASTALQVEPTYTLDQYSIQSGNIMTSSAQINLIKDGVTLTGISVGDGPIDAAFRTIEQITGRHFELDDFQIQAITEGHEATGSAIVKLRSGGKLYSGKGLSTDIIGASIRAYIIALNKILYEEA
ncbi:MAG: 2-isopropylmalate synthase, partial [Clostridia bacterium]|nr:2-isopropylmalate synthase [Clostridia bacterium]